MPNVLAVFRDELWSQSHKVWLIHVAVLARCSKVGAALLLPMSSQRAGCNPSYDIEALFSWHRSFVLKNQHVFCLYFSDSRIKSFLGALELPFYPQALGESLSGRYLRDKVSIVDSFALNSRVADHKTRKTVSLEVLSK